MPQVPDKIIEVPGSGNVAFPGSMSDDDIAAQIHSGFQGKPETKSAEGFLSNVVSSTGNLIGDAAHAVTHPVETLNAIGAVPVGLWEKLGGPVPAAKPGEADSAQMLDAMLDHFKQRYGSIDNAKETLYKDPAGVMADLSTVLGGSGELADAARLGKVADAANTLSKVTDPFQALKVPAKAAVQAAAKGLKLEPEAMYAQALRPRVTTPVEDVREMAQTGLQTGLPVSEKGAKKLEGLLQDLQQKIDTKVQAGAQAGVTVDPNAVATRVDPLKQRFAAQVNPASDLKALERSRQEFLDMNSTPGQAAGAPQPTGVLGPDGRPVTTPGQPASAPQTVPIPADQAQAMKIGTYQKIRQDYGALSTAQIESQKALARGLKEELNSRIPELASLNDKQSKFFDLQPVLESAVNRAANQQGGFKHLINSAAAESLTKSPGVGIAYGLMQDIMQDPMVKSQLAILINKAQQLQPAKFGAPSMATALSRVDSYANPSNP